MSEERSIALVVTRKKISEQDHDRDYWLSLPPAARLAAVEEIRREYHAWKYGAEPGFQRVYRVLKR